MRPLLRRSLIVLGIATLAAFMAVLGGFSFVQTAAGKAWLESLVSRSLSSPETTVMVAGLEGTVPFDMRVREVRLADSDGVWAAISDVILDIAASDLLRGRLTVRRVGAGDVTVARRPAGGAPASADKSGSIPQLPVDVAVREISIARIRLEEPVLGEPVTAALTGNGSLAGRAADATISIERLDGAAGHARLAFRLEAPKVLALHVDVAEPSGLLLKRMLGRDDQVPLTIAMDGEGPLDSWRGTLRAAAGDLAQADARFTIAQHDGYRIASDGVVALAGLLPPTIAPLLPEPLRYSTTAVVNGDVTTVEALSLTTGAIALKARGHFNAAAKTFAGEGEATLPDLGPVGVVAGTPLKGTLSATINADGTLDAPRARVSLSGRDIGSSDIGAGVLSADIDARRGDGIWRVTSSGTAEALTWPADRPGLPQRVDWQAAGETDEGLSRVALDRFLLRANGAEITASGVAEALHDTPRVKATARLAIADLAAWRDLAGLPLEGRFVLDLDTTSEAGTVTARGTGEAQDLGTGQAALDALLGKKIALNAVVNRRDNGAIRIDSIRVDGAHVTVSADATLSADLARVEGTAQLDAPRLAVLSAPLGKTIGGAMTARAQINGALARPQVKAEAVVTGLQLDAQRLDRLSADVTLSDAAAPAGTLAATFKSGPLDGKADATFARTGPGTLSISRLSVTAPGTEMTGALAVRTDALSITGNLAARVADLRPWSGLAGTRLAGSVEARATLAARDGQRADIDARARDLQFGDGDAAIQHVKIEARLADLLGKPSGKASVEASVVTAPDLRADTFRVLAQSSKPGAFTVSMDTHGTLHPAADPRPFRVSATTDIAVTDREQRLRLTRLTGRVGEYDISSQTPLTVAIGADRVQLDGLDLRIGQGRLTGSASRAGERLALKADIRDLPVAVIELAAPEQKMSGTLGGSLTVAGTVARPEGRMDARIRDLRFSAGKDIPPLAVSTRAAWKDALLELTGRIDGPDGTGIDLIGTLPLTLDPGTLAPAIPRDRAIRLEARGDGRIESWADALPIGEDRVSGRYAINVVVRGTLESPDAGGRFTVADGRYVSFTAGTELSNLNLELVGDGKRFTLKQFAATDAAKGTFTGSGFVDLAAVPGPAIEVGATFANFQVMRRDDITGTAGGELRLGGTVSNAILSGRIQVDRAEIRIPERLPPNIPRLEVVEVDSRHGEVIVVPEQPRDEATLRLDLDINIPARAFVRGRGLDSEWRGDVHVAGTVAKPVVTGKLETVRGDFSLLGKRFVLSDSTIEFDGSERIDPQLNIAAEHKAKSIVAQAIITGPASNPSIKLTSQPELPQDEILARVLFGRSVSEITAVQALQLAQAAAALAGRGGPDILDRVRMATGLDRLDISSGEPSSGGPSGPKVTAGEYVTDKVFVGVEQGVTPDSKSSTRSKVEVELTPNVTVESSVGSSSAGVGVNWKWDY